MSGEIDKSQREYFEKYGLETYKSLIQIGTELSRLCIIANGGAAIALLAYLGNAVSKGRVAPDLVYPMYFYATGVFLGCLYAVINWVVQFVLYGDVYDIIYHIIHGNIDGKPRRKPKHMYFVCLVLSLAVIGMICFLVGSIEAVWKFQTPL